MNTGNGFHNLALGFAVIQAQLRAHTHTHTQWHQSDDGSNKRNKPRGQFLLKTSEP